MKIEKKYFITRLVLAFLLSQLWMNEASAQQDSIVLKNGNTIVGEIKSLNNAVLAIGTNYSKNDFTIKWSGIKEIYTTRVVMVTLNDGRRINGSLKSSEEGKVGIAVSDSQKVEVLLNDIVYLKGLKSNFWSRVSASVGLGLNFTKANNLRQLTINSNLGYLADKWQLETYFNIIRSAQDSIEATKRTDVGISYKYFLQKDWFLAASLNFLSNTEQALKLRSTGKLGAGNFIMHTNSAYWTVGGGLSFNNESFTNNTPGRKSLEGYVGTELNFFDIGDLSLLSSLYVYPSFTESGRWRSDFRFDAKYSFLDDFYLKSGLTLNYDNKPAVPGKEIDYVIGFTIGWDL